MNQESLDKAVGALVGFKPGMPPPPPPTPACLKKVHRAPPPLYFIQNGANLKGVSVTVEKESEERTFATLTGTVEGKSRGGRRGERKDKEHVDGGGAEASSSEAVVDVAIPEGMSQDLAQENSTATD